MLNLPKELLDIIHTYNCEHRPMMKTVLNELMTLWYYKVSYPEEYGHNCCHFCSKMLLEDYVETSVLSKNRMYCNDRCKYFGTHCLLITNNTINFLNL